MSTGAYLAIKEKGLRIPEDIGFAMFDDPDWASLVTPGVSAVRQPVYTLGSTAADLLVKRIKNGSGLVDREPVKIVLEARFIERGSM
jgi:DNA-binding LacI/PurR family transcriptional regulator